MIKRFHAQLNDGSYINVVADRMELKDNMLFAYDGTVLVALVDISAVISAKISNTAVDSGVRSDVYE